MSIKEIALDLTVFTLSNVNDAISFKPQLCFEVPKQDYQALKNNYINFTGTSIRKNRSKLFFLPTNVSDELQRLNPSIPENAKTVPNDGRVYYKNRLITELDYENVKRVETACAFIAYTALNSFVHFETEIPRNKHNSSEYSTTHGYEEGYDDADDDSEDELSPSESVSRALRKGNILGFRELGHLVGITPWHFHRVFKVITGLTIREYGQLCVEFIKKNKGLVNTCRIRVEQTKVNQRYSCLDDCDFLKDGALQYAATENVVLLHEYFIDPNKSKEFKKRKNTQANATATANANSDASKNAGASNAHENEDSTAPAATQRSEIRKRRSSVMYGRMQRATQSSITSNSSLYECLTSPKADLKTSDYCLTNEHNSDNDNDNDTDTSTSSIWEPPTLNIFPPTSVSPSISSRKNSIISIGSCGSVTKGSVNKVCKRKSITSGANIDAIQSTILHRRNRSDGCSINLSLEPLHNADLSLDSRLSLSPAQFPIEFNSNVFNSKSFQAANNGTNTASLAIAETNNNNNTNDLSEEADDGRIDFSVGPLDYNFVSENLASLNDNNDTSMNKNEDLNQHLHNSNTNVINSYSDQNYVGKMNSTTSMTDISLFNNSLMDHTTPSPSTTMNALLGSALITATATSNTSFTDNDNTNDNNKINNNINDFTMDEILNKSATGFDENINNAIYGTTNNLTTFNNNSKVKDIGSDYFLNSISTEDDGLLFESSIATNDGFSFGNDNNFTATTTSANNGEAFNF